MYKSFAILTGNERLYELLQFVSKLCVKINRPMGYICGGIYESEI